jgi:uncharacterized membrane protein
MAGSPLYYILLRGWVQVAGASLFALRYFSVLWGTLTIPFIYRVTRRLLGGQIALATALIAVFAPFCIYYSQEARAYSLTLVLMLVSMFAFLRWLDARSVILSGAKNLVRSGQRPFAWLRVTAQDHRAWWLATCCLANLICLYTHFVAALVIAAQGVILLLVRPIRWKDIAVFSVAHAAVGLAFSPWLWRVWRVLPRVVAPADSTTLDAWSVLARTWTEFSVGRTLAPPLSLYLAMLPLFLALAGLLSLFDTRAPQAGQLSCKRTGVGQDGILTYKKSTRVVILIWLIVPILGSLMVPRASVRFSPKYLIAITPVYYTLIVLGLAALRKESRALFWMCVIALVGTSLYSLGDYYLRQHDKLAQIQRGLPEDSDSSPGWSLFAEDTLRQESQHIFEVTHRGVAHILGSVRWERAFRFVP